MKQIKNILIQKTRIQQTNKKFKISFIVLKIGS